MDRDTARALEVVGVHDFLTLAVPSVVLFVRLAKDAQFLPSNLTSDTKLKLPSGFSRINVSPGG